MSLFLQVSEDIKKAMLARQKDRLEALRAVKTAFLLARAETGAESLPEDQENKILQKLIKQRMDAAGIYKTQNRMDLYQKEVDEAAVIKEYLPKALDEEEIVAIIRGIIQQVKATSPKDMGRVMGAATKELAGKADNRFVADKIRELLTGMQT
jgi:hypothetical protein